MDFSIVEGKKLNSTNGIIYLKCTLARHNACQGLAKISTFWN